MIENLSKVLPLIALIAVACTFLGWSIRGAARKPAAVKAAPTPEAGKQERVKNLEAALEKSRAAHKATKAELDALQAASISKSAHESVTAELEGTRKALDSETKRISTLETDLKKAQDTNRQLNARANEADKTQKDRSFALENELSKAREQLALLDNRPNDSAALNSEIERLRESVATSTRFAGEMRKREASAIEALGKAEARVAELVDPARAVPVSKKIGPVVDSGRIAAAKAEVLRLVEKNRQKELSPAAIPVVVMASPIFPEPLKSVEPTEAGSADAEENEAIEEISPADEEVPLMTSETPVVTGDTPIAGEQTAAEAEEAAAIAEDAPVAAEEARVFVEEETPAADQSTTDGAETAGTLDETPAIADDAAPSAGDLDSSAEKTSVPRKNSSNGELFALD